MSVAYMTSNDRIDPSPQPIVAMIGAGQLAQMTHQAAISLGVDLRVLAASPSDPAVRSGAIASLSPASDWDKIAAFACSADAITVDHEQVPPMVLERLELEGYRISPAPSAQLLAQDKHHARTVLARRGLPVPPFALAQTPEEAIAFAEVHGWPLVAKAPRGGYDGHGVQFIRDITEFDGFFDAADPPLLEPVLEIERELSVLVARNDSGEAVTYPVTETIQIDGMCRETLTPAPISEQLAIEARELALKITDVPGATGIIAVELFLVAGQLVINELAMRPHNSGHYTIEGSVTSQFEQHLRAILDWPLGSTSLTAPACVMVNVTGPPDGSDPRERLEAALAVPHAHVHLYSKGPRPGRKLGHVTACGGSLDAAITTARTAAAILEGRR